MVSALDFQAGYRGFDSRSGRDTFQTISSYSTCPALSIKWTGRHFYYIKVGFEEVKIIQVCFRDDPLSHDAVYMGPKPLEIWSRPTTPVKKVTKSPTDPPSRADQCLRTHRHVWAGWPSG